MKRIMSELKDGVVSWGSFICFIAVEMAIIAGVCKLLGLI